MKRQTKQTNKNKNKFPICQCPPVGLFKSIRKLEKPPGEGKVSTLRAGPNKGVTWGELTRPLSMKHASTFLKGLNEQKGSFNIIKQIVSRKSKF